MKTETFARTWRCFAFGILGLIALSLSGCATAHKLNKVSLGMTKAEVIKVMGNPVSTSATAGVEYLNYRLSETDDHAFYGVTTPYFVRIVDGKVESYGRTGDFDSTKPPTTRLQIETRSGASE